MVNVSTALLFLKPPKYRRMKPKLLKYIETLSKVMTYSTPFAIHSIRVTVLMSKMLVISSV